MKRYVFVLMLVGLTTLNFGSVTISASQSDGAKREVERIGVHIPELGRNYLAYPDTTGTISFNNCWLMGREPLIETWIEEFKRFYPNITVINDNLIDCTELLQYQKTLIEGRVPPAVLMIQSQNFSQFTEIDAIRPLDDWINRDGIDPAWFYASEWNARRIQGRVYGLPNVTAGAQLLMFYKRKYLEHAGLKTVETWQDLEALSKVARASDIFIMDPGKMSSAKVTFFQVLLYANGGKLWDDAFTKITWNSQHGREAAQWLLRFVKMQADNYEALRARGEHREIILAEVFATGPYIAALNGPWFFYQLYKAAPDLAYVVAPFPRNASNADSLGTTPIEGGWSFSIANDISTRHQAAAWEWIKFTTLSKYACEFTVAQSRPSPVRRCNEDKRLTIQNPHWDAVKAALERAQVLPVSTIHLQLQDLLINMQDAILFEQMSPEKALKTYAEKAQALLDAWNHEQRGDQ